MANPSNTAGGTVLGLIAGLVVLAGIIAAPFYARHMRTEQAALDDAVAQDVDVIRRAVASIDANLGELAAIRATDAGKLDSGVIEGLSKRPPALNAQLQPSLDAVTQMLKRVQTADEKRGTRLDFTGRQIKSGVPEARAAIADAQKALAENKELLATAKKAASNLEGITKGSLSARQHIGVLQAQSALHFAEGRLSLARAVWERQQAADLLSAAAAGSEAVVDMKRTAEACGGAAPTAPLELVEKKLQETDTLIGEWQKNVDNLSKAVAQRQTALEELKRVAAEARDKLAEMDGQGVQVKDPRQAVGHFRTFEGDYRKLAEQAAKAEREAAEIEYGTIRGGTLSAEAEEDILKAAYEGGTPQPGLRDVKIRVDGLKQLLEGYKKIREDLRHAQAAFKQRAEELAESKSKTDAEAGTAADQLDALLGDARKHTQAALVAADAAAKSFATAADLAGKAQAQAKKRSSDARSAATASGGTPDERLNRIGKDGDTEAGAWYGKGEADYHQALTMAEKILAITAQHDVEALIAKAAGTRQPEDIAEVVSGARGKGLDRITAAIGSFDQWINLTKNTSLPTEDGRTIAGKDLLWQGQVAKAAALLLKARLEADEEVARGATTAAYDLLREAVQGKEQSPLLQEALATMIHVQKTAD